VTRARLASPLAVCIAFGLSSGADARALKPITGTLSAPGYSLIALASDGSATSVTPVAGRFSLRPPAPRVSLHLRDAAGKYAGPLVARREGRRAIVGVRAGARLGAITVARGYARVNRRLPSRWLDPARSVKARRGVPIGARVFGRVRTGVPRKAVHGDRDVDGVPDSFDIDDDGDLILDNLDRSRRARTSQIDEHFGFGLVLAGEIDQTVNANAAAVTVDEIDALLTTLGGFEEMVTDGESAELDCGRSQERTDPLLGGLVYCSRGGTGRVPPPGPNRPPRSAWQHFPDDFDSDDDGLGTITGGAFRGLLSHGATSAQIGTGDVLVARVINGGAETQYPIALQYVAVTVPALVSYDDARGNSRTVTYPVPGPDRNSGICAPGSGCPGPGTRANPFPVKARGNGDVVVTFTIWRPQRARLPKDPAAGPGDSATWTDIGRLNYNANECWPDAYSEHDADLTPVLPSPGNEGEPDRSGLLDGAADRPANPNNTLTFTVNLTKCRGDGEQPAWNVGQTNGVSITAAEGLGELTGSSSSQEIFFKREQ
jgi:hypothetical protein